MARVLVLSDDPQTRDQAERFLADQGHDVARACSAEEAARSLAANVPDLVLADCTLLGEHAAMQAARAGWARGIRVILMTADGARARIIRRANLPALEKPPALTQLGELVDRALSIGNPGSIGKPSLIGQSLALARDARDAITRRLLQAGGGLFDRYVREYRHRGLHFEIPLGLTTPEFRARLLLHRYEVHEQAMSRKYIAPDATVLELGGCLGVVSCAVNRRLADPRGHVVFEAHPLVIPYLEANRARNGCLFQVRQQIVSNAPTATFFCRDPFIAGSSTVRLGRRPIEVPTTTVERVERETGLKFDSLLIDIEGGEREFTAENSDLLARVRSVIIELHPHIIGNAACAEIRDRFAAAGLTFRDRRGCVEAWLRPVTAP